MVATIVGMLMVGEFAAFPLGTEPYRVDLPAVDRWLDDQPEAVRHRRGADAPVAIVRGDRRAQLAVHAACDGALARKPCMATAAWNRLSRRSSSASLVTFPSEDDLSTLVDLGVRYVVMHTELYRGNELADVEERLGHARTGSRSSTLKTAAVSIQSIGPRASTMRRRGAEQASQAFAESPG